MKKGERTKQNILETGIDLASQLGLEGVSIGVLAKAMNMSKSGLFAHFKSKENLQIEILSYAGQVFSEEVLIPSLRIQAGIPRIKALVNHWIAWASKISGGCIFVTTSTEFSDRPGRVRDFLTAQQEQWLESLRHLALSAIKAGDFREDIDLNQFAFDLYSMLLGFHFYYKLLQNGGIKKRQEESLQRLLDQYRDKRTPRPGDLQHR
jgi:AcrR family transcriptional regulator